MSVLQGVDQGLCSPVEIVAQDEVVLWGEVKAVDRGHDVLEPTVALGDGDLERGVSHPQPRVPPVLGVRRRTPPVLLKKHPEPHLSRTEVLGVERSELWVAGYARVELPGELAERLVSSHLVVEAFCTHHTSLSVSGVGGATLSTLLTVIGLPSLWGTDPSCVESGLDPLADLPGDREVLFGAHLAMIRMVITPPTIDSTLATTGSSS